MTGISRTIVVTGVDGFVGRHVAAIAHSRGHDVVGLSRQPADAELRALLAENLVGDLTEGWPSGAQGDAIIHLAGLAAVGPSFAQPQTYIEANSRMLTHLGEHLLAAGSSARVIAVSTGAVYASSDAALLDESAAVVASSPYVVSKLLVESQTAYYRTRGLDAVVARPFNHIGPGQSRGFLVPDLAADVRALEEGDVLPVGNLATTRDYTDVRDVATAYLALVEAPELPHTLYNVASGIDRSGEDMLRLVAEELGVPIPPTSADQSRFRATDASRVRGDADRLRRDTGWVPHIDIRQSVRDFVAG